MPCIVKQSTNSENETTKRKPGGDKMKEYVIPKLNFYSFNSNLLMNTFLALCLFVCFIWERTLVCKSYNMWLLYCYWLYTIKHSHIGEFKLKWLSAIYGTQPKSGSPKCPGGSENFSSCWRFIDVFLSLPSSVHSPCQLSCFLSSWFWGSGGSCEGWGSCGMVAQSSRKLPGCGDVDRCSQGCRT